VFERGFKTWCEKYATEKRITLGLDPTGPLDTLALAINLGVKVHKPADIPNLNRETLDVLLRNDGTPSCWSAVTLVSGSRKVVILNSAHSSARQASDLTHELAHIIRGHSAQEVDITPDGLMLLKSYDKLQEEEADWLSGCLLLPRDALVSIKRRGLDTATSASLFGVSVQMLNYRMARSGVNRQYG
jgi:Zn-dependent peptidase ImmA (M78 family)